MVYYYMFLTYRMKKIISANLLVLFIFITNAHFVFAQEAGTLIPETSLSQKQCYEKLKKVEQGPEANNTFDYTLADGSVVSNMDPAKWFAAQTRKIRDELLSCGIMTGNISFWMIPYFIVRIIEFIIGLSGLGAILMLIYGGYEFIMAGATDKQDSAKKTISHAIIGLIVVLVAWVLVNLVQFAVTF